MFKTQGISNYSHIQPWKWTLWAIVAGAGIIYGLLFYPGVVTADTQYMLNQAAGLAPVSNWHPPVVTLIWMTLWKLGGSAGLLWISQISLWLLSVGIFASSLRQPLIAILAALILVTWPFLVVTQAVLWKDAWLIGWGLLAVGCGIRFIRKGNTFWWWASLVALALFLLTRYNAIFGAVALLGWIAFASLDKSAAFYRTNNYRYIFWTWLKRSAGLSVIFIATVLLVTTTLSEFYVEQHLSPWATTAFYDIVGISVRTQQMLLPDVLRKEGAPSMEQLSINYRIDTSDNLIFRRIFPIPIQLPELPETRSLNEIEQKQQLLGKLWIRSLINFPHEYLAHRAALFATHLGLGEYFVCAPYHRSIIPNHLELIFPGHNLTDVFYSAIDHMIGTPLFSGEFVLLLLAFSFLIGVTVGDGPAIACAASGLLMLVGNFFLLPACDARYLAWCLVAALLAWLLLADTALSLWRWHKNNTVIYLKNKDY